MEGEKLEMASNEVTQSEEQHSFTSTQETVCVGGDVTYSPLVSGRFGDPYVPKMLKKVQHLLPLIKECTRRLETAEAEQCDESHVQESEDREVVRKEIHELQGLAKEAKEAMETLRSVFNDLENKVHQLVRFADESARGTADGAAAVNETIAFVVHSVLLQQQEQAQEMKEIKQQRNSLKEDHSKAQEKNRKVLADMENKHTKERSQLREAMFKKDQQIKSLEDQLEALNNELSKIQEERKRLHDENKELRATIGKRDETIQNLNDNTEQCQANITKQVEEIKEVYSKLRETESTINDQIQQKDELVKAKADEIVSLQGQIDTLTKENQELHDEIKKRDGYVGQLESLQSQLSEKESKLSELTTTLQEQAKRELEVCKAVQDAKQPESCASTLKEWGIALQKMMDKVPNAPNLLPPHESGNNNTMNDEKEEEKKNEKKDEVKANMKDVVRVDEREGDKSEPVMAVSSSTKGSKEGTTSTSNSSD